MRRAHAPLQQRRPGANAQMPLAAHSMRHTAQQQQQRHAAAGVQQRKGLGRRGEGAAAASVRRSCAAQHPLLPSARPRPATQRRPAASLLALPPPPPPPRSLRRWPTFLSLLSPVRSPLCASQCPALGSLGSGLPAPAPPRRTAPSISLRLALRSVLDRASALSASATRRIRPSLACRCLLWRAPTAPPPAGRCAPRRSSTTLLASRSSDAASPTGISERSILAAAALIAGAVLLEESLQARARLLLRLRL
jgi:hypothetical protein